MRCDRDGLAMDRRCVRRMSAIFALFSVLACNDRAIDFMEPDRAGSELDGRPLDPKRMAELRAIGEGCAVSATDGAGVRRGFAMPRGRLPFAVPAIDRDPATGLGNGIVRRIVVHREDGPVTWSCWFPNTFTREQLAVALAESRQSGQWTEIFAGLRDARELPEDFEGVISDPEAMQFEKEMLAGTSRSPTNSALNDEGCWLENRRSSAKTARFDCFMECEGWDVTIWFNGDTWSIHFQFYACESQGGGGYGWLIGNGYLPWCGGSYPNDADVLREQYRTYSLAVVPGCEYFSYQPSTTHFGYDVIRSHDRDYAYAILRNVLATGLETLYGYTPFSITTSNRVYSSPAHQAVIGPGAMNSRHVYGDAADIHSTASTWQPLRDDASNLSPTPCAEPLSISTYNHVHLDYRVADGALNRSDDCPTGWALP